MHANGYSANILPADLTQYMNYVAVDTSSYIDAIYTGNTHHCSSSYICLRLHNGSLVMGDTGAMGGSNTTNGMWFAIDPNGVADSTTNGPSKSLQLWIYYNGRVSDIGSLESGTRNVNAVQPATPSAVPPWFSW